MFPSAPTSCPRKRRPGQMLTVLGGVSLYHDISVYTLPPQRNKTMGRQQLAGPWGQASAQMAQILVAIADGGRPAH